MQRVGRGNVERKNGVACLVVGGQFLLGLRHGLRRFLAGLPGVDVLPITGHLGLQLAGFYNRQGRFDKTIESLNQRAEIETVKAGFKASGEKIPELVEKRLSDIDRRLGRLNGPGGGSDTSGDPVIEKSFGAQLTDVLQNDPSFREQAKRGKGTGRIELTGSTVREPRSVGQPRDGDPRACYAVLEDECARLGLELPSWAWVDSLPWVRQLRPGMGSYALAGLARAASVLAGDHRVRGDVVALAGVLRWALGGRDPRLAAPRGVRWGDERAVGETVAPAPSSCSATWRGRAPTASCSSATPAPSCARG